MKNISARTPFATVLTTSAIVLGTMAMPSASSAASNSHLVTTWSAPAPTVVNSVNHYDVNVVNSGSRNTPSGWSIVIQLPKTNTSPTQVVMGTVSNISNGCVRSGTRINCTMNAPLARNGGRISVGFDMSLPYSVNPLTFRADAIASNDDATANWAVHNANQSFVTVPGNPGARTVDSCTGTNLSSFFECTAFPGSIQRHLVTLASGGLLDFSANGPDAAGMDGTWSVNGTQLTMNYAETGAPVGTFIGQGVSVSTTPGSTCWEGRMTFIPASPYTAMYRVCS